MQGIDYFPLPVQMLNRFTCYFYSQWYNAKTGSIKWMVLANGLRATHQCINNSVFALDCLSSVECFFFSFPVFLQLFAVAVIKGRVYGA